MSDFPAFAVMSDEEPHSPFASPGVRRRLGNLLKFKAIADVPPPQFCDFTSPLLQRLRVACSPPEFLAPSIP